MRDFRLVFLAWLATMTLALPAPDTAVSSICRQTVHSIYTFDNISSLTGVFPAVGARVHPENALYYNAWTYINGDLEDAVLGLEVLSKPNVIGTALLGQVVNGRPFFNRTNGTVESFSLKSLYFICGVGDELLVSILTSWTVQLTGKKAVTGVAVVHELLFKLDFLVTSKKYTYVKLADTFSDLIEVDLQVLQSGIGANAEVVPLSDNVEYTAKFNYCIYD